MTRTTHTTTTTTQLTKISDAKNIISRYAHGRNNLDQDVYQENLSIWPH